jgi:hypothetical protein
LPPIKISEVYSSIARFESPTYGTYLIAEKQEVTIQSLAIHPLGLLDNDAMVRVLALFVQNPAVTGGRRARQ